TWFGLLWNFFQCNCILSLALLFTIILIWGYIIQYQNMKDALQQSYCNILLVIAICLIKYFTSFSLAEIATPAFAGAGLLRSSQ
ncbi:MAG: hypothetical protein L6371_03580, partial [Candidatus Atribacteria bacterium]|nr:hypothetical protein [Candidatus Atribacteria bacterium]